MSHAPIIGRFAPTPSGPLHFGSLVTALASYCHARSKQGQWRVRIEDVDTPRVVKESGNQMLKDIEAFGFEWDGEILYQSSQFERYEEILQWLLDQGHAYACQCSRKSLRAAQVETGPLGMIYPGFCRNRSLSQHNHSIRLNTASSGVVAYQDLLYGKVSINIPGNVGDFVIRRVDGIYAYHLAVVLDDELQGINQVVRGADLLEATCLHLYLQRLLGLKEPEYLHIPLIRNELGDKLSKQTGASAIDTGQAVPLLISALKILGQSIDDDMVQASPKEIVNRAVQSWDYQRMPVPQGDIY